MAIQITQDYQGRINGTVFVVDTMQDLVNLSGSVPNYVYVSGYHTKGDGAFGGYIFEWDPASTEPHNGGTTIELGAPFPTDWNDQTQLDNWFNYDGGTTGRYKLRYYNRDIDVKWFGAIPNNSAIDNRKSINKAIEIGNIDNSLNEVFYASGIYCDISNRSININLKNVGDFDYLIQIKDCNNIHIKNLILDGNKNILSNPTKPNVGIEITNVQYLKIDYLKIFNTYTHGGRIRKGSKFIQINNIFSENCGGFGFVIEDELGSGYISEYINIDNILIKNCGFWGNRYSGFSIGDNDETSGPRNISIGRLISIENGRDGIALGRNAISPNTGPQYINIDSLFLKNNKTNAIELFGCRNVNINSIYAEGNTKDGVAFYWGNNKGTYVENINVGKIIAKNNGYYGLHIVGANNVNIQEVILEDNAQDTTGNYNEMLLYTDESGSSDYETLGNIKIGQIYCKRNTSRDADIIIGGNYLPKSDIVFGSINKDALIKITKQGFTLKILNGYLENIYYDYSNFFLSEDLYVINDYSIYKGQTTDGISKPLARVKVPVGNPKILKAYISCKSDDNAHKGIYEITALVENDGNGTQVRGTPQINTITESDSGLDVSLVASGSGGDFVNIHGIGLAGVVLNWEIKARVF